MNPFNIGKPCIKISNSELLFEQYRIDFKRYKYDIEDWDDGAIKRNLIFFDFMQQTFNRMDGLYMDKFFILVYTMKKGQLRKHSATEVEWLDREKSTETQMEHIFKTSSKKSIFLNETPKTSQATRNTYNSNFNADIPQCSEAISSE